MELRRDTLIAFENELAKIAEEVSLEKVKALQRKLVPGDVLVSHLRNPGLPGRVLATVVSTAQGGTPDYHAAMYVDGGKVLNTYAGTSLHKVPLKEFADRYSFKALRVRAPEEWRRNAVAYAKKQVGKDYDLLGAIRQVLPPRKGDEERQRQQVDSFYCSQFIANAYNKVPFAKERAVGDTRPVDLDKSRYTKIVGEVR